MSKLNFEYNYQGRFFGVCLKKTKKTFKSYKAKKEG